MRRDSCNYLRVLDGPKVFRRRAADHCHLDTHHNLNGPTTQRLISGLTMSECYGPYLDRLNIPVP